jgi:squalene-associated FAD-dependent desaturase
VALAEAGLQVDVYEASSRLGGRASSFRRLRTGIMLDLGQHVLLGCCANLIDFYGRVGALEHVRFLDSITFAKDGVRSHLRPCRLPEPFHLLPSLLSMRQIAVSDRLRSRKLLTSALQRNIPAIPADQWLGSTGQSRQAIDAFWSPILTGALNDSLDRVSARYAAMVIRQAMLVNREGFSLGLPTAPLSVLHDELPRRALSALGCRVHNGNRGVAISNAGNRAGLLTLENDATVDAEYYIVAVDPATANTILPPGAVALPACQPEFCRIVTLYLWYRQSVDLPSALCIAGRHFGWCFNKQHLRAEQPCCEVAVVASAARGLVGLSPDQICKLGLEEICVAMGRRLPEPDDWEIVQRSKATFSPSAAYDETRPPQSTNLTNTFLAGDWTATGWPGTMESAVRSGYAGAREILAREGLETVLPVPDLPARALASRFMGAIEPSA